MAAWHSAKWQPKAKGTYRYYVYAKDLAGNAQSKVVVERDFRLLNASVPLACIYDPTTGGLRVASREESGRLTRAGRPRDIAR